MEELREELDREPENQGRDKDRKDKIMNMKRLKSRVLYNKPFWVLSVVFGVRFI